MSDWKVPYDSHSESVMNKDYEKLVTAEPKHVISCHHRQGMKILEHFQPHFWETESPTGESIANLWNNEDLRNLAIERVKKHYNKLYKSEVRRNISFYSQAPLPTMYRPLLTKSIVSFTQAKHILDPCIGWGGRLLGTLCLPDTTFTGCEPNTKTFAGLNQIAKFCKAFERTTIYNDGAENILPTLQSEAYDLILTSPPYFTLEIYCHEDSQSVNQYKTWEEWVTKWLDLVIKESLRCLKKTGTSAWSVKNMPKYALKDEVIKIHKKYGFVLKDTMGMSSTPRNQGQKAKINEETFLFNLIA